MENWFLDFEEWLGGKYGFAFVVHFEDIILFAAGVFLGMIIMSVLSGRVVFKLQKISNLGSNKIKLVKFKHEGTKQYIADPKTVGESVETLLLVIFRPLFQTNDYTYRDEKRTKYFLIFLAIIGILLFALALICITTVVQDGR
ncbi:hypothetical protein [Clostridium beijerinckii]|uniref:hypothetical protein n=1 Tax=Clostridium beijerinckii TaxID=1520 RepID=UPI0014949E1F|nr:hypothetical protein [Clostridium beijerinckii]NOW08082.1 di/tricarboxylate transporter [Clostridium beijerinckii]NYC05642.1 di/tricarboxylate transporter [Clostridium beijerinckii]